MIDLKIDKQGWKIKRLQFCASILNSNVDKKIIESEIPVKLCNYVDVYKNDIINEKLDFMDGSASLNEIMIFTLKDGDVIITKDSESADDIGIPAFVEKDLEGIICGYHLAILKPFKEELNGKFLFYYLKSNIAQTIFELGANGVTRFGLSKNAIKTIPLPLPELQEQSLIAKFLDNKTKQIDRLITQKEKLLKLLTEKRTAIISQAVTKGLDPNVEMVNSDLDWLGETPKHWKVKRLKFLASSNDEKLSENEDPDLLINYVEIGNVSLVNGIELIEELKFEVAPSRARRIAKVGDVIVSTVRTYLKAIAFIGKNIENLIVSTGFAVLRSRNKDNLLPKYLGYCIQDQRFIEKIVSKSVGVSYPAIGPWEISEISVAYPSIDEQKKIVEYLDDILSKQDKIQHTIKLSINKLREYREALITAAVTGQIDVRKEVANEHTY